MKFLKTDLDQRGENYFLMEGTVYVLTNPAMPNMVKIDKTTRNLELRMADLFQQAFQ